MLMQMDTIITEPAGYPILYTFRRCPYAMRARMALRYAGIKVQMREVVLADKPSELLALSPKGTVPVLQLEGRVIEESYDIMLWALQHNDPGGWLAKDAQADRDMQALIRRCDVEFKPRLDAYKYAPRNAGIAGQHAQEQARGEALVFLSALDNQLAAVSGTACFLYGPRLKLADVCLFPFIRQFAFVDKVWFDQTGYLHLRRWLEYLLASDLFLSVMRKHPQWSAGDPIIIE